MFKTALKIFASLFLIYIGGIDCHAEGQKYHDEALYWLKGGVSEVKTKTKSQLPVLVSTKFNEEGRESISLYAYNDTGYPVGYGFNIGESVMEQKVEWNGENAPKSISYFCNSWPSKGSKNVEFYYDDDQYLPVKAVSVVENGKKTKKKTVVCEYSNYKLDDHGNWISRYTKETVTENKKGKEKQTTVQFEETRTIIY